MNANTLARTISLSQSAPLAVNPTLLNAAHPLFMLFYATNRLLMNYSSDLHLLPACIHSIISLSILPFNMRIQHHVPGLIYITDRVHTWPVFLYTSLWPVYYNCFQYHSHMSKLTVNPFCSHKDATARAVDRWHVASAVQSIELTACSAPPPGIQTPSPGPPPHPLPTRQCPNPARGLREAQ